MNEHLFKIGALGQWIAGVLCGIGFGVELALKTDIGYVLITGGALLFAAFTKVVGVSKRK